MRFFLCLITMTFMSLGLTSINLHAEEETRKVGPAAKEFIEFGIEFALANCGKPSPPRNCRSGRLLQKGPLHRLVDQNSGEPYAYQELKYEGMALVYRADTVVALTITGSNWAILNDLRIGTLKSRVMQVLGAPSAQFGTPDGEYLEYCAEVDCASFVIESGTERVRQVTWDMYYD
jgi:hypothetical protein